MFPTKQKDDLERQIRDIRSKYPDHIVFTDIAFWLSFKWKGLKRLLESVQDGYIKEIVVARKYKLARFGTELIEWFANRACARIFYEDNHCFSS
jgi:predicted site-specific integrase-resolvase